MNWDSHGCAACTNPGYILFTFIGIILCFIYLSSMFRNVHCHLLNQHFLAEDFVLLPLLPPLRP